MLLREDRIQLGKEEQVRVKWLAQGHNTLAFSQFEITALGSCAQRLSTRKFLLSYWEKIGKGKKEKWGKKEEKLKSEGEKFEMEGGKVTKWGADLFFFKTEICFGSTKMEIFLPGKSISRWEKKSGKLTLPPQKKFPVMPLIMSAELGCWTTWPSHYEQDPLDNDLKL